MIIPEMLQAFEVKRFHTCSCIFCSFSAPEISLNPDGGNREEVFYSDSCSKYHSVDAGAQQPLIADATRPTNYSV